jgi:hypothetical protein
MNLSSAQRTPIRSTSKHERRLVAVGISLFILAIVGGILRLGEPEIPNIAAGAAGLALVRFVQLEALSWRRPLTPGHQLAMWWFWPIAVPVFLFITRNRRSVTMTLAVIIPVVGFLVVVFGLLVVLLVRYRM